MNKLTSVFRGASGDSLALIAVKLVTTVLSLCVTRIMADVLSITEYGTYSQVMLLVSTISSITVLGMIDAANYFFYHNHGPEEREAYLSTILSLQYLLALGCGTVLLACSRQIVAYFGNEALRGLLIFAGVMPLTNNLLFIFQVLFVAIGKARQIAVRNLVISILRLVLFWFACQILQQIAALFIFTLLMEIGQIIYFRVILRRNGCAIHLRKTDFRLTGKILSYCIPMAAFLVLNTLTRDCDRYVISALTDTDTLAVYTNASKVLPFDIIMASFCTVLVPYLTQYISEKKFRLAAALYRQFLELAYLTTAILAGAAIAAAPMLMQFLYSEKYLDGLGVFVLYIVVDIIRFTNITLVLSASGRTKSLMFISGASLLINLGLNLLLFHVMGIPGPAVSTLTVTLFSGLCILACSARAIHCRLRDLFDGRQLLRFSAEIVVGIAVFSALSRQLALTGLHYVLRLFLIGGGFALVLLALNLRRLLNCFQQISQYKLHTQELPS